MGVGAAGALAGCDALDGDDGGGTPTTQRSTSTGSPETTTDHSTTEDGTSREPANLGGWPMYSFDAANSGCTDEIAPINGIGEFWRYDTRGGVRSPPIVHLGESSRGRPEVASCGSAAVARQWTGRSNSGEPFEPLRSSPVIWLWQSVRVAP